VLILTENPHSHSQGGENADQGRGRRPATRGLGVTIDFERKSPSARRNHHVNECKILAFLLY
jgi:hypothetical protein